MGELRGLGRTIFASVLLTIGGVLNIVWGIAAISNSHFFTAHQNYIFASLNGWGWISLILGIFELIAAASLVTGGPYGRWFGVLMGSLVAIEALFAIPAYPFWSLAVFALSIWIIHGLLVYGESAREVAAPTTQDYTRDHAAVS